MSAGMLAYLLDKRLRLVGEDPPSPRLRETALWMAGNRSRELRDVIRDYVEDEDQIGSGARQLQADLRAVVATKGRNRSSKT